MGNGTQTPWDIGLDRGVPLNFVVRASSGSSTLDLTGLQTDAGWSVDASSGDSRVVLPAADQSERLPPGLQLQSSSGRMEVQAPDKAGFTMSVEMSSGDTRVTLGMDSAADVRFRGSSGQFLLAVRPGQAFRVEVQHVSSGDVTLPDGLHPQVSGEGKEGVWQTSGV